MRPLEINKIKIYYANPEKTEIIYDEWGNETGEKRYSYHVPKELKINVSPAQGSTLTREFGDFSDYDKIMVTSNMNLPLNEQTVLWVDNPYDPTVDNPYDYRIRKVAKGLHAVNYAIQKVNVNGD